MQVRACYPFQPGVRGGLQQPGRAAQGAGQPGAGRPVLHCSAGAQAQLPTGVCKT